MANVIYQKVTSPLINLFGTVTTLSLYDDGTVTYNKKRKIFSTDKTQTLKTTDVQFYTISSGIFLRMLNRNTVYFGYHEQIEALRMGIGDVKKFRDLLCANGAPIGEGGKRYGCWNLFNPISWFRKEYLYATPSGIRYEKGKQMSYIPYDKVAFFYDYSTWYTLGDDVVIYGEQYILPKAKVHGDFVEEVKSKIEDKKSSESILRVRPGFFWRLFHPFASSKPLVFLTKDMIVSIDDDLRALPLKNVTSKDREKEHWYSFWGTIYVEGVIDSIRKDQGERLIRITKENIGGGVWDEVESRISSASYDDDED